MAEEHHGKIWWSELLTRDTKAARDYYAKIAGWTFETMPMGEREYLVAHRAGAPVAGIMDMNGLPGMDEVPPHWFTYIAVEDVDAAVRQTRDQGGEVRSEPFDVAGIGRIAIVADPSGAVVGLITPAPRD